MAYLWGSKLAKFVKSMEALKTPLEGFGEIKLIEGNLRGVWSKDKIFFEERKKMETILNKLSDNLDEIYEIDNVKISNKFKIIRNEYFE